MGLNAFNWRGLNNGAGSGLADANRDAGEKPAGTLPRHDVSEAERWVDVPREEWVPTVSDGMFKQLPEERQRFYQQRNQSNGDIRLVYISTRTIEAEVLAHKMDLIMAALDKLEQKLR